MFCLTSRIRLLTDPSAQNTHNKTVRNRTQMRGTVLMRPTCLLSCPSAQDAHGGGGV